MDLLIQKNVFTKKEILNKIDFNVKLWENVTKENKALLEMTNDILEDTQENEDLDEEFSGLYYGPTGEC
jgi:hypothetical protein